MTSHDYKEKEEALEEAQTQEAMDEVSRVEDESIEARRSFEELETFVNDIDKKSIFARLPFTRSGRMYRDAKITLEQLDFNNKVEEELV